MLFDSAIFFTRDLDRIVSFYRDELGFELEYLQENRFASFTFANGVHLGIKVPTEEREIPGHQTIFISVPDPAGLEQAFKDKGIAISHPLRDQDWATHFSILDPDENKVLFCKKNRIG